MVEAYENGYNDMRFIEGVECIDNFGNLGLSIDKEHLFEKGYEYGDVFKITVNDKEYHVPFVENYSQVAYGEYSLCTSPDRKLLTISKNMMGFAGCEGFAISRIVDGNKVWELVDGDFLIIALSLYEKAGYLEEFKRFLSMGNTLQIGYDRSDYQNKTDEEYANFRMVAAGNIKEGILYRGSSPYKDNGGRADIVNDMFERHNINTVVSLELAKANSDYVPKNYNKTTNTKVNFELNPVSLESIKAVREAVLFVNDNDGPYFVNCVYGKDRTGAFILIIEALMGANIEEITRDYDMSFCNLFNIEPDNSFIEKLNKTTLIPIIKVALNVDDPYKDDLKQGALNYMYQAGLAKEDIDTFIGKLGQI